MSTRVRQCATNSPSRTAIGAPGHRTIASYESELRSRKSTEAQLRSELAGDEALLEQKDAVIKQLKTLGKESDHRMVNGLQLVASLISMQSRASANADTSSKLAEAANRVIMIERIHRRLHCLDGVQSVAFKKYLEDFCREFSTMLSSEQGLERFVLVEGPEIDLPAVTAVPLGFVINELLTNAVKYGKGRITVRLERALANGCYALSVSNEGFLPEGFDTATCNGFGMKIVRSLVEQIGGELRASRGDQEEGTRFTVLFPSVRANRVCDSVR